MSDRMNIDGHSDSSSSDDNDTTNVVFFTTPAVAPATASTVRTRAADPSNPVSAARRQRIDSGSDNPDSLLAKFKSIDLNRVPPEAEESSPTDSTQPFAGGNDVQNAMWKLIARKVFSGFEDSALPFTCEDEASFQTINSIPNAYNAVEQMNDTLFGPASNRAITNPAPLEFILRVYLEGALDAATLCQQVWDQRFGPAEDMRHSLVRIRDRFHNRVKWRFGTRTRHGLSVTLSQDDFNSFLHDPLNQGWLTQTTVNSCLLSSIISTATSRGSEKYWLLDSNQIATIWSHFALSDLPAATAARINLPSRNGFNLLIPIWIGSHCSIATVTWSTGLIQYYNSQAAGYDATRAAALDFIEWLLASHRGAYKDRILQRGNLHAVRQIHFCDCGVLAVEAGLAFIEQRLVRDYKPALRASVMGDLVERCMGVDVPDWDHPNTPRLITKDM